jgi:hypothetical protein
MDTQGIWQVLRYVFLLSTAIVAQWSTVNAAELLQERIPDRLIKAWTDDKRLVGSPSLAWNDRTTIRLPSIKRSTNTKPKSTKWRQAVWRDPGRGALVADQRRSGRLLGDSIHNAIQLLVLHPNIQINHSLFREGSMISRRQMHMACKTRTPRTRSFQGRSA